MKIRSVLVVALLAGAATTAMASNDSTGASIPWQVSVPNSPSYGTDATLYDNGPIVTHPGGGFGGANASALMSAFGGTIFGFGAQQVNGNRMADDFVIPVGQQWKIDSICFFTYQTGSTTVSTITGADMNLWSGAMPGTTLAGASSTIKSNQFSGAYRALDTTLTNNQRPVMVVEIDFGGLLLGAGQHWIDWAAAGSPRVGSVGCSGFEHHRPRVRQRHAEAWRGRLCSGARWHDADGASLRREGRDHPRAVVARAARPRRARGRSSPPLSRSGRFNQTKPRDSSRGFFMARVVAGAWCRRLVHPTPIKREA
jgi:hypothetical protein